MEQSQKRLQNQRRQQRLQLCDVNSDTDITDSDSTGDDANADASTGTLAVTGSFQGNHATGTIRADIKKRILPLISLGRGLVGQPRIRILNWLLLATGYWLYTGYILLLLGAQLHCPIPEPWARPWRLHKSRTQSCRAHTHVTPRER